MNEAASTDLVASTVTTVAQCVNSVWHGLIFISIAFSVENGVALNMAKFHPIYDKKNLSSDEFANELWTHAIRPPHIVLFRIAGASPKKLKIEIELNHHLPVSQLKGEKNEILVSFCFASDRAHNTK